MSARSGCDGGYELWCADDDLGTEALAVDLDAGEDVLIVIGGWNGASGAYTLDVEQTLSTEVSCADGIDDDHDYQWDCGDPDCANDFDCREDCTNGLDDDGDGWTDCPDQWCTDDPACAAGCPEGTLQGAFPIVVDDRTDGLTNDFAAGCVDDDGSDVSYAFTAPVTDTYTFTTEGSSYDTVLSVYDDCTGITALACDDDGAPDATSWVQLPLAAGQSVVVVVDGYEYSAGSFTLTVDR
ncbi:MAG: hypothetical protein ABMB14_34640 [Myxococcota bacterium]